MNRAHFRAWPYLVATLVAAHFMCVPISAAATLDDAQMENLVRRSYQYVAMYNVNNNFAM